MAQRTVDIPRRSKAAAQSNGAAVATAVPREVSTAAHQAFWLLRITFTIAPILFGADKFFNWSVHWPDYLAHWINNIVPGSGQDMMYVVGGIEIATRQQHVRSVAFDERPPAPDAGVIGGDRSQDVADGACQRHPKHRELPGCDEVARKRHDDLARQRDARAFNGHRHEDSGIPERGDRVDDEPTEERDDRFDETAHLLPPGLACLTRSAPPADGRLPRPQLIEHLIVRAVKVKRCE